MRGQENGKDPNRRLLIYLYCCPTVILYHIINTHAMVAASVLNRITAGHYTHKFIYGIHAHAMDKEPSSCDNAAKKQTVQELVGYE